MSHQPGHPPGYHAYSHPHSQAHPAYSPQPVPYGYAPPQEYQPELEALPSIRSLSSIPPVSVGTGDAGLGTGMGVGLGLGQPFYGVMPMGAQLVQSDFMARYPALPPDHRFRGPKKEIKRRTKTGCMTCRKRRIKCDETHPTCNNCRKSKRECLGYDPIFKQQQQRPPVLTQNPEQRPPSHGAQTPQTPQPQPQPQPSLPTPHQPQGHLEERYLSYSSPISLQQQQTTPAQTGPRDARAHTLPSVAALSETYPPSSGGIDPSVLGPVPMQGFGHPSGNLGRPPFGPTEHLGGRQPGQGEPMVGRSLSGGDRNWEDRHLGLEPEFVGKPFRGAGEAGGYGPDATRSASRVASGDDHGDRSLRGVLS